MQEDQGRPDLSIGGGANNTAQSQVKSPVRMKFVIGGLLIVAAVVYLIVTSTQSSAQYFLTVQELKNDGSSYSNREIRVSGAVVGDSISYDAQSLTLKFTIVHIPGDNAQIEKMGGLAAVLHQAVSDSSLPRMQVAYQGVKPDLLRNEAQAILTGRMGTDGVFKASELLLKCPTKYEEALPEQAEQK